MPNVVMYTTTICPYCVRAKMLLQRKGVDYEERRIEGDRELIYGDVVVRVNPNYRLAMHIDTDEGNAANIRTGMLGYIEEIQSRR